MFWESSAQRGWYVALEGVYTSEIRLSRGQIGSKARTDWMEGNILSSFPRTGIRVRHYLMHGRCECVWVKTMNPTFFFCLYFFSHRTAAEKTNKFDSKHGRTTLRPGSPSRYPRVPRCWLYICRFGNDSCVDVYKNERVYRECMEVHVKNQKKTR